MMNTHAFVNIITREVERLLPTESDQIPDGHELVALAVQVRGWPEGRGTLRCSAAGALSFDDQRTLAQAKQEKAAELRASAAAEMMGFMDEIGELLGMIANGQTLPAAYKAKMAAYRDKVQARRTAIQAATTVEEVDAIQW